VADITYIRTRRGWLYVAAVMDLFSRKIIDWGFAHGRHTNANPAPGLMEHVSQRDYAQC